MMYQNVDVPKVRAKYGGGYVGADLTPQGRALGAEAIRQFGLKSGDKAIVFGAWDQPGRYLREEGTAKYLEEQGLIVNRITGKPEWASDPNLLIPSLSAAVLKDPETKVIVYSGGQQLGAVPAYMDAIKKKPGEIINIGFDTSPAVIDGFKKGFVQLTSDQQPFLQGYMPILSLALSKMYGLGAHEHRHGRRLRGRQELPERGRLGDQGLPVSTSCVTRSSESQLSDPALPQQERSGDG